MEIIPRPILERVSMRIPDNVKALLNVRGLDVYDILQLLVNTLNKIVRSNDGNIDKEEEFLAKLSEALNDWAEKQEANFETYKNMILNYIETGELYLEGFITSSKAFGAEFWAYLMAMMLSSGQVVAPETEGSPEPEKWMLKLSMQNGSSKWIDLDAFYKALYNASTVWLEMDEKDGASLKDEDGDNRGMIPFAKKDNGGLMHKDDKAKLDGIRLDASKNILYIDDKAYQLTPYVKPETEYNYTSIGFLGFDYTTIEADGGKAYPSVSVGQQVLFGTGSQRREYITAYYHYDEDKGKMVTDYTGGDFMKEGGKLTLEFEVVNALPSNVLLGKDGVVQKTSPAESTEEQTIATIRVRATMNGEDPIESTQTVNQFGASIGLYKGSLANTAITQETFFDVAKSSGVSVTKNSIASDADWFTITRTEVSDRYVRVYYTVTANNGSTSRTANVTAMTSLSAQAITIATITQSATAQSITAEASDNIGAGESDFRDIVLNKTAGVTLTEDDVHTDADWINITAVDIEETKVTITYTADANPNTTNRTATIVVDTNLGEASCVITIAQAAKAVITVSPASLSFEGTAGGNQQSKTLTVKGQNLVGNIKVEVEGQTSAFSASTQSIGKEAAGKTQGTSITVYWTPTSYAGTSSGTLKLSTANADAVEVSLSGVATGAIVEQTGYHGATSTLPSTVAEVEAGTSVTLDGVNTVSETGAKNLWVAVPTGSCSVTCVNSEGGGITLKETIVGSYTVYSWSQAFVIKNTSAVCTITLL